MKTRITLIIALLVSISSFAQQGINYKALIKDANGNILVSAPVTVQFIITDANTTSFYQEIHTVNTDANGLIILNIGEGTTSDIFTDIDWANDDHFLNVQIDTGFGLVNLGTTQFMAVPYALNALTSSDSYWDKNTDGISNINDDIGIGSEALNAKLEIFHNSTATKPHILLNEEGNDFSRISFTNTNSANTSFTIGGYIGSNARSDRLNFSNDRTGNLLTLTGEGKVGIGVGTSPKTDFHVGEDMRVLFGKDTIGPGDKLMFLPHLHAFRVGTILSGGLSNLYWNPENIGSYSFASGINTRAQGIGATAMGGETEASNDYAFATGYFTNAYGQYSTAMGFNTSATKIGTTALGYETDATGEYATSIGNASVASGNNSVAIGNQTQSQSFSSTAIGSYNIGGGNADTWVNEDPILEVGIGQLGVARKNALTILKDGKHGILTHQPKANLHVSDDGTFGSGTIVAILESDVSDRPILQFSESSTADSSSGMSIEYDGSGSGNDNKMHINKIGGLPMVTFENSGQVGIGITSPTFALHLPNNSITGTARANSWGTYSDQRIKSNIVSLQYGLESILSLRPVTYYQHKSSFINSKLILENERSNTIGLLAQEVHAIIPEAVIKPLDENEQLWGMDYDKLIPVLIKALQEQNKRIDELEARLNSEQHTASTEKD